VKGFHPDVSPRVLEFAELKASGMEGTLSISMTFAEVLYSSLQSILSAPISPGSVQKGFDVVYTVLASQSLDRSRIIGVSGNAYYENDSHCADQFQNCDRCRRFMKFAGAEVDAAPYFEQNSNAKQ
jgi:hypothetical protein